MAWLRLYDGILDSPKIQMLSDRAFRMLVNLWCLAKRNGGTLPGDMASLAFSLRQSEGKVRDTLQALISAKLIDRTSDGYEPHDWGEHQYDSDSAAERMRRYRERNKKQQASVTEPNEQRNALRNSDVPDTDSEADTETENTNPSDLLLARGKPLARKPRRALEEPDGFAEFYTAYPKHVARRGAAKAYKAAIKRASPAAILAGAIRYATNTVGKDAEFIKHPTTWLNQDCWADEALPLAVVGGADPEAQRIQDESERRAAEWERELAEARKQHATG